MDAEIIKLEKQIEKLTERIETLEKYGKSVYEAIQMLSEDYTNKSSGGVALYNGILSKLDKYDFVSQTISQPLKQEKWIVHRTLRTQNKETYLVDYFCKNNVVIYVNGIAHYCSYDKNKAYKFKDKNVAIQSRDVLNTVRVGKQYLWVISKVEE